MYGLLGCVDQLSKGLDLSGCVAGCFSHLQNSRSLCLSITHLKELSLCQIPGKLFQGLRQDIGGQPSLLQGLSETPLVGNHLVNSNTVNSGSVLQRILKHLAAHTGVDH